ncbi:MAG: TonB-dependent receptor [Ferruginibacter sp.]
MNKLFLFIVLLISMQLNAAEPAGVKGSLSGRITDGQTGKPVAGVSVYFADAKAGTTSNEAGEYFIGNLSDGYHLVEVSHVGFNTIAENILINGDTKKDFSLTEAIVENNAVIITGVSKATQLKKMPFQVSVIKQEELQRSSATNIIEAVTKKAGVASLSSGPAISKPVIRGLGYNRVLTINDGVRQEGQQWGDEHGIEIDESSVNKVEILKGPASLMYGSDAMAGVLNIISNVPVQTGTSKLNLGSNFQTNNKLREAHINWAGNLNGFNWNVYTSQKAAADYKNKFDGPVFNSKFKEENAGGYIGYNGAWGYSHLLISNFDLTAGLIEGERDDEGFFIKPLPGGGETRVTRADFNSIQPAVPYQHIRHFKLAADNNFKIGKNRLALNIGWQRNRREEFGNPDDLSERELFFDLKTVTYTSRFHFEGIKGWKPSIGINGMQQTNTNRGAEQLIPDYQMNDAGLYVFLQKEWKKATISGGIRYDLRKMDVKNLLDGTDIKGTAFKRNFENSSASIGSTIEAGKNINIKLNLARAYRAPSIPELASNGSHEGTNRYEYGDRNLKSETSFQTDAGIEMSNEHFSLNLAAYYNHFNNFIFYRKLQGGNGSDSLVNVDGNMLTAFTFSQRKANISGLEISFDLHPHPFHWLHLENTFSLVNGSFADAIEGSKNIPFMPAPKLLTELRADVKKLNRFFQNFYARLEMENMFTQKNIFTAFNTETKTPGYTLLHAGIGTDCTNKKGHTLFSINIAANNISNVAYQNHLSRLKYAGVNLASGRTGVYNMGANFSFKLMVPLEFRFRKEE